MQEREVMMTAAEFRQSLADLGLGQVEFGKLTGTSPRTVRFWVASKIPNVAAVLVRLLLARPELVAVVKEMSERKESRERKDC